MDEEKSRQPIKVAGCLVAAILYYLSFFILYFFGEILPISDEARFLWFMAAVVFLIASVVLTTIKETLPIRETQRKIAVAMNVLFLGILAFHFILFVIGLIVFVFRFGLMGN